MERSDSTFTAFIPDSLVKIQNFIVSAEVVDSLKNNNFPIKQVKSGK